MSVYEQGRWSPTGRGWRAALSGIARDKCPYEVGDLRREDWLAGYADAKRTRPEDVAAVRAAVADADSVSEA